MKFCTANLLVVTGILCTCGVPTMAQSVSINPVADAFVVPASPMATLAAAER
jgi:hypothetical protein